MSTRGSEPIARHAINQIWYLGSLMALRHLVPPIRDATFLSLDQAYSSCALLDCGQDGLGIGTALRRVPNRQVAADEEQGRCNSVRPHSGELPYATATSLLSFNYSNFC